MPTKVAKIHRNLSKALTELLHRKEKSTTFAANICGNNVEAFSIYYLVFEIWTISLQEII